MLRIGVGFGGEAFASQGLSLPRDGCYAPITIDVVKREMHTRGRPSRCQSGYSFSSQFFVLSTRRPPAGPTLHVLVHRQAIERNRSLFKMKSKPPEVVHLLKTDKGMAERGKIVSSHGIARICHRLSRLPQPPPLAEQHKRC